MCMSKRRSSSPTGVVSNTQPSIGDSVSRYHGWAEGNPDLFKADRSGSSGSTSDPDIYKNVSDNPDLQF